MNWLYKTASLQFMYHGTNAANLSTILSQGLNENHSRVWDESKGQRDNSQSLQSFGGIYFSSNFMTAYGSAGRAADKKEDDKMTRIIVIAQMELTTPSVWLDEDRLLSPNSAFRNAFNMILEDGSSAFLWWIKQGYPDIDNIAANYLKSLNLDSPYLMPHAENYLKAYAKFQAALGAEKYKDSYSSVDEIFRENPEFNIGYQQANSEFIAASNIFSQKVHSLTEQRKDDMLHNVRIQEPVNFRGKNKIVVIASMHDSKHPELIEGKYYCDTVLHYNKSPEAVQMLIDDAKKSLSHALRVRDTQGNIYYDQPQIKAAKMDNWQYNYKESQKAMALPFDLPENPDGGYRIKRIDRLMDQETADQIRKEINPSYLNSGMMGIAMNHSNPNTVLKLTEDPDEAETAEMQMENNYPFLVKVYSVRRVQNDPQLWLIESERVKTLSETQQKIHINVSPHMSVEQNLSNVIKASNMHGWEIDLDETEEFIKQVMDLKRELILGSSVRSTDINPGNVGFNSQGRLVLLDLGLSKVIKPEPEPEPFNDKDRELLNQLGLGSNPESKAMPLPFNIEDSSEDGIIYDYDKMTTQETSDKMKEKYQPEYLNNGACGIAMVDKGGYVLKLTNLPEEAAAAEYQMENNFPFIVKVYNVEKVQDLDENDTRWDAPCDLWAIQMEKVDTSLNYTQGGIYGAIRKFIINNRINPDILNSINFRNPTDKDVAILRKHIEFGLHPDEVPTYIEFIKKSMKLAYELLKGNKWYSDDCHSNNIGFNSKGDLVLFDLGYSETPSSTYFPEDNRTKEMPMPFDIPENIDLNNKTHRMIYRGLANRYDDVSQESADQLKKQYNNPEYVGSGALGVVMSNPNKPNTVIKISHDEDEVMVAERQMQEKLPFLVQVYGVNQFSEDPPLWTIELEKVQTLNKEQREIVKQFRFQVMGNVFPDSPEQYFQGAMKFIGDLPIFESKDNVEFLKEVAYLTYELSYGNVFMSDDAHGNNLGVNSQGRLVLLDLGRSAFGSEPEERDWVNASSTWKYTYGKAMPLPFDPPEDPGYGFGMGSIDRFMNQETADKVRQEYSPEFLGQGDVGVAMSHSNPNTVLKLTDDKREAITAEYQMEHNIPFLVKVFKVEKIQNTAYPIWLIEIEKVQVLNDMQMDIHSETNCRRSLEDNINNIFTYLKTVWGAEKVEEQKNQIIDFIEKSIKLKKEVKQGNIIRSDDAHAGNVGFNSQGELVLFDLGMSYPVNDSKPMPLPFEVDEEILNRDKDNNSGVNRIDRVMDQETADQIREEYSPSHLGQGNMGIAMNYSNPDHVLKLTDDEREMLTAELQKQNNYPFLVKVYNVTEVQNDPQLWLIEMDRITELEDWQKSIQEEFYSFNSRYLYDEYDEYLDLAMTTVRNAGYNVDEDEIVDFVTKSYQLIQELEYGKVIRSTDYHGGNIGFNPQGKLVLFDLGLSKILNPEPEEPESKSMPLPFDTPPEHADVGSGVRRIDIVMDQGVADNIRKEHQPYYFGSGDMGVAMMGHNPNLVLKLTDDPREAETAEMQMYANFPFLVGIHDVKKVQKDPDVNLWLITMDKVRTLESWERNLTLLVRMAFSEYGREASLPLIIQQANDEYPQLIAEHGQQAQDLLQKMFALTSELYYGDHIRSYDGHSFNVGFDSHNNLVLFDLGLSYIP